MQPSSISAIRLSYASLEQRSPKSLRKGRLLRSAFKCLNNGSRSTFQVCKEVVKCFEREFVAESTAVVRRTAQPQQDDDTQHLSPLHKTALRDCTSCIEAVLRVKTVDVMNIATGDQHGNTPLHISLMYDNCSATKALLANFDRAREAFIIANEDKMLPIHVAACRGCTNCVNTLLEQRRIVATAQMRDSTIQPMHLAAQNANAEALEALLLKKQQPLARTNDDLTVLHCAIMSNSPEAVNTVLYY